MADGVQEADWAPDGTTLMIVRDAGGKSRIEFPLGKILYETSGHVSYARLSPKGDRIAFLDHPFPLDDAGTVAVIDLAGKKTTLTGKWASEGAWPGRPRATRSGSRPPKRAPTVRSGPSRCRGICAS